MIDRFGGKLKTTKDAAKKTEQKSLGLMFRLETVAMILHTLLLVVL